MGNNEGLRKPALCKEQVDLCMKVAGESMMRDPVRLGQAFLNAVWSELRISCVWPELYYQVDDDKSFEMIKDEYYA